MSADKRAAPAFGNCYPPEVFGSTVAFWTQFFYSSEIAEDDR